ncbi:hypothetical protein HDU84_002569 [Entophlyctis sp. JEL0112]|nr:hypothetical protein HDU84_002569 [Entophlyctis sp. JEL0112]
MPSSPSCCIPVSTSTDGDDVGGGGSASVAVKIRTDIGASAKSIVLCATTIPAAPSLHTIVQSFPASLQHDSIPPPAKNKTSISSRRGQKSKLRLNKRFAAAYKLKTLLGIGGFGLVCGGVRNADGLPVAVKFISRNKVHSWTFDNDLGWIPTEIYILMKHKNPAIIKFIDFFEDTKLFYLVTELFGDVWSESLETFSETISPTSSTLCSSHSSVSLNHDITQSFSQMQKQCPVDLFACIEKSHGLEENIAKKVFRQIIQCLDYLHANNISHRDLKDENIVVDSNYSIRVIDFGSAFISHAAGKDEFHDTFHGTVEYAAPEALSQPAYQLLPADMWSCGVLLFVMLSGSLPFASVDAIVRLPVPPLSRRVSHNAKHLLHWLLRKNPDHRPVTAEVLCHPWLAS